jgi:tRNA(Ile)-lysidine synthase
MVGPPAPVAAVRVAVRRVLRTATDGGLVLVACSGGPDSTALAAATAFEAPRAGLRAGLVTVDHGLQPGSLERARAVAAWGTELDLAPVEVVTVMVDRADGPEGDARRARYAALDVVAKRLGACQVLLGHTRTDQAETVLLGLARGSGARSLAGMAPARGVYRRPLLELDRATTVAACAAVSLPTWDDPHNVDPAYARSRLRGLLPVLDEAAGGGLVAGLARSAALLRADADLLDELAADLADKLLNEAGLDAVGLGRSHPALRGRVLRRWALSLGAPAGALTAGHVAALDALCSDWHGQGPVHLPGGLRVMRRAGLLESYVPT